MKRAASLLLIACVRSEETAKFLAPPTDGLVFADTFQSGMGSWVKSGSADYAGQPISLTGEDLPSPYDGDMGLLFEKEMKRYGIARKFDAPVAPGEKPLVIQYEVTLTSTLTCGGAYIKVLESTPELDLDKLDGSTPYIIMFGPDKCGDTNKVHFIFRHKNPSSGVWEEKHLKSPPKPKSDSKPHTYTLIVRPDNEYEILIDDKSEASGSLLEDFDPPVNPRKIIDDPDDSKPADWVDVAKIDDPDASKPDDWDEDAPKQILDMEAEMPAGWLEDAPDLVADPEAVRPADWDDEEDGEWEAPLVANPACEKAPGCGEWKRPMKDNPDYKGKWVAPKIDNPEYKGEWEPRKIDNPHYFVDEKPSAMAAMGAIAVEIWTTNPGIRMDNFAVSHDEKAMKAFYQATLPKKLKGYDLKEKKKSEAKNKESIEKKRSEGGWQNKIEVAISDGIEMAKENPAPAIGTALVLLISFFMMCCRSSKPDEPTAVPAPTSAPVEGEVVADADDADDDEDEDAPEETE